MNKNLKNAIKIVVSIILIIVLCLFVYFKLTNKVSLAALASVTEQSKQRPLQTVKEWTNKVNKEGRTVLRSFTGKKLDDVLPQSQIFDGDEKYYVITKEDLRTIPSLFCTARGVFIPGYGDTLVYGNPFTDQGKETAYLTEEDISTTTIFRSANLKYKAVLNKKLAEEHNILGALTVSLGATNNISCTEWEWEHSFWDGSADDNPTVETVSTTMNDDYIYIEINCQPSKNTNTYGGSKTSVDDVILLSPEDATLEGRTKIILKRKKDQQTVSEIIRINIKGTWNGSGGNAISGSNPHYYNMTVTYTNDDDDDDDNKKDDDETPGDDDDQDDKKPQDGKDDDSKDENPSDDGVNITIPKSSEEKEDTVEVEFEITPKDDNKIKNVRVKERGKTEENKNIPENGGTDIISFKKDTTPGKKKEIRVVTIYYDLVDKNGNIKKKEKTYSIAIEYENEFSKDITMPSDPGDDNFEDSSETILKIIEQINITGTKSATYAKYKLKETRDATPAEAWVLAEAEKNVIRQKPNLPTFTSTNEEYTGQLPNDTFPFDVMLDGQIAFVRVANEIIRYAKENNYKFGDSPFNEYDKKEINGNSLVEWALYSLGFDGEGESAGYFFIEPNEQNASGLKFGDVFWTNESEYPRIYIGEGKALAIDNEEQLKANQPIDCSTSFVIKAARVPYIEKEIETPATRYNANVVKTADGKKVYIVGTPGEERFIEQRDGKFYYCTCDDEFFPSNYVENAWWKVKTVGEDNTRLELKDTALAREAEAFEQYIKQVTGQNDVTQLERNEDGTFKIDYKVSMEPTDTSVVKTRFNSITNKYIVGPFKVNYLRAVTKQGDREKVSFAGISGSILVGVDAEGNELLDENGNSRLQLGKNYRFVYSNSTDANTNYGHNLVRNNYDTDEDYPYPSSGEEFYIEIDYLDDLVELSNFKFDFQYLTSGGQYDYYTGDYYEIDWEGASEKEEGIYRLVPLSSQVGAKMETDSGSSVSTAGSLYLFPEVRDDYSKIDETYNDGDFSKIELIQSIDSDTMTFVLTPKNGSDFQFDVEKAECTEGIEFGMGVEPDIIITKEISVSSQIEDGKIKITVERPKKYSFEGYSYEFQYNLIINGKEKKNNLFIYTNIYSNILPDYTNISAESGAPIEIKLMGGMENIFVNGFIQNRTSFKAKTYLPNSSDDWIYYTLNENEDNNNGYSMSAIDQYKNFVTEKEYVDNYCYRRRTPTYTSNEFSFDLSTDYIYVLRINTGDPTYMSHETKDTGLFKMGKLALGPGPYLSFDQYTCSAGDKVRFWNAVDNLTITNVNYTNETCPVEVSVDSSNGMLITSLIERNTYKEKNDPAKFKITDGNGNEVFLIVNWEKKDPQEDPGDNPSDPVVDPTGENPTGENPTGSNPTGENPTGSNPTGGDPTGSNPTGGDPTGSNPTGGNPTGGNPTGSNPTGSNPTGGNPTGSNPTGGDPTGGNPTGSNPTGGNPTGAEPDNPVEPYDPTNPPEPDEPEEATYGFYLIMKSITSRKSQDLINAFGEHPIYNIDAHEGLADSPSGSPIELEMFSKNIDLRTSISGYVWIDDDEFGEGLGVYNKTEKMAEEGTVEIVVWKVKYEKSEEDDSSLAEIERNKAIGWTEDAKTIDFEDNKLYIDNNGKYKIPEIQVPSVEGNDGSKYFYAYDVEFIYDGQNYEATEFLKSTNKNTLEEKIEAFQKNAEETKGEEKDYNKYSNNSYAVENRIERQEFDKKFTEIYGGNPIDDEMKTKGYATDGEKEVDLLYDGRLDGVIEDHTVESILDTLDDENHVYDKYRLSARVTEGGLLLPYEYLYHGERECYDNLVFQNADYKPVSEYFNQINFGLLERKVSDINVTKDVYETKLVVNDVETDITFNKHGDLIKKMLILESEVPLSQTSYRIDLYNADYYYRSDVYNSIEDEITKEIVTAIKQGTELRAFITYRIAIHNGAKYSNLSINEFKDYYDDTLTLVTEPVEAQVRETTKRKATEESTEQEKTAENVTNLKDESNNTNVQEQPDNPKREVGAAVDEESTTENEENDEEKEYYFGELTTKIVAQSPHYRKLAKTEDNNYGDLYNYLWEDDKNSGTVKDGVVGDLVFEEDSEGNGFKVIKSNTLKALSADYKKIDENMAIKPGEIYEIFVTYEVDKESYDNIQKIKDLEEAQNVDRSKLLGSKNNIAEISRYSTQYIDKTRTCTSSYEPLEISGGVDTDAAPDNMNISKLDYTNITNSAKEEIVDKLEDTIESNKEEAKQAMPQFFEDDTGVAPVLKFNVRKIEESRAINGIVWDDGDEIDSDSVYKGDEEGIKDAEVTMVEKIRVRAQDLKDLAKLLDNNELDSALGKYNINELDYEFDYIWPEGAFKSGDKHVSKTNTGEEGEYTLYNYVAGNYIVKFDYGANENNIKYNGQDYKNTSYIKQGKGTLKNPSETSFYYLEETRDKSGELMLNNEWHNLRDNRINSTTRYSDARDYEPRRLQVMAYSKIIANNNAEVLSAYINEKQNNKLLDDYKEKLKENTEELINNTSMNANTAKLDVEIEHPKSIIFGYVKTVSGSTGVGAVKKYNIDSIDFGLVRRPETKINIQDEINEIRLYKNDGTTPVMQVYMDEQGNIVKTYEDLIENENEEDKDEIAEENDTNDKDVKESEDLAIEAVKGGTLPNVELEPNGTSMTTSVNPKLDMTRIRKVTEINKKQLALGSQGFKYVAIEPDYLVGMTIAMKYKIKVFNNSDIDYTSYTVQKMQTPEELYDTAFKLENDKTYLTGQDITYGTYVGLYYYTGEVAIEEKNDKNGIKQNSGLQDDKENNSNETKEDTITYANNKKEEQKDKTKDELLENVPSVKKEQLEKYGSDKYVPDYIVTTTVSQVTDYIDTGVTVRFDGNVGKTIDNAWGDSTEADLNNKVSIMAYSNKSGTYTKEKEKLVDVRDAQLINLGRNNVQLSINELLTDDLKELETKELKKTTTGIYSTEKAKDEKNLVKVQDKTKKNKLYTLIDSSIRKEQRNSEFNIDLTQELLPKKAKDLSYIPTDAENSKAQVFITISEIATAENIDRMSYNNMAEVMVYSNSVGRRDLETIPGNAFSLAKEAPVYSVGYNVYVDPEIDEGNAEKMFERLAEDYTLENEIDVDGKTNTFKVSMERDQYAARDTITFSEPTGLYVNRNLIKNIVAIVAIIGMIGTISITLYVIGKRTRAMCKNIKKVEDINKK